MFANLKSTYFEALVACWSTLINYLAYEVESRTDPGEANRGTIL